MGLFWKRKRGAPVVHSYEESGSGEKVKEVLAELEQVHAELAKNEERMQLILDSIPSAVLVFDTNLTVTFANKQAVRMLGSVASRSLEEIAEGFVMLKDNTDLPEDRWPPKQALREKIRVKYAAVWRKKDGKTITAEIVATPFPQASKPEGVLVTLHNLAPQLALERELREFIAIASHQLRTPLATISWFLEILLSDKVGQLSKQQWELVEKAREATLELIDTSRLILDTSRIELGVLGVKPEPKDIDELLTKEVERMKLFAERKEITLTLENPENLPTIPLDENVFVFILVNLLSNAIKYTDKGGKIWVKGELKDNRIVISVSDTGVGIPKKDQPNIFKKFSRGENVLMTSEGTGLGLYAVKMLVDRVGAQIWFDSEEGKGTTFTVAIPVSGFKEVEGQGILASPVRPLY